MVMLANDRYDSLIKYYAEKYGLDWTVLKKQIDAESSFNPDAVSPSGAEGLAQFMPPTLRELAVNHGWKNVDAFNPECSIKAQATYMAQLMGQFGGDIRKSLAAYNAGPGRVGRLVQTFGSGWELHLSPIVREYLTRILGD